MSVLALNILRRDFDVDCPRALGIKRVVTYLLRINQIDA